MIQLDFSLPIQTNIDKLLSFHDDWILDLISFLTEWSADDEYIILETSGTTGAPKKIKANKSWLNFSANNTLKYFNLQPNNTALLALSVKFIAGKMMTIRAINGQLKLWLVPPNDLSILEKNIKIDFCPLVPMQAEKTIENLYKIKHLLLGGGSISSALEKQLKQIPTNVYHSFAMTETFSHFAIKNITKSENDFTVFDNIEIGANENSCLWIKAPELGIEFIQTSDLVELTQNGFKWISRFDFIINSGGIKYNPEILETKCTFLQRNNISFIISSIPDNKLENKIVLVIENQTAPKSFKIISKSDFNLDKYAIPKMVFYVNALPRTTHSNKIKRLDKASLFHNSNIISSYNIE